MSNEEPELVEEDDDDTEDVEFGDKDPEDAIDDEDAGSPSASS